MILRVLFTAFLLATSSFAAQATDFTYSFDLVSNGYGNTDVITGGFSGNLSGDLITNITNISIDLNGNPLNSTNTQYTDASWNYTTEAWQSTGGVLSLDGKQNNFLWLVTGDSFQVPVYNYLILESLAGVANQGLPINQLATYVNGGWKFDIQNVQTLPNWTVTAVPVPAAVWLFASTLAGFGLLKKRKTA